MVQILDQDGDIVCEIQSAFSDDDLDPLFRPGRFQVPLANSCFGRHEVQLRAFVNDVQFARTICNPIFRGSVDHISLNRCAGWLTSPSAPRRRFEIEFYRNGELVATGRADRGRADLRNELPAAWQCGSDVTLPSESSNSTLTSWSLRLPGSDFELFDGPYVIGDISASIAVIV